jgi:hypothetical protein
MTFDLELEFRESIEGEIGEVIENKTVFFDDRFFVEILLADFRDNATGIVSASLNIEFESTILNNVDEPFNPSEVITEKMPILPTGELNNATGMISDLGASSIPRVDEGGSAIGVNELERFAVLEFEVVGGTETSTIEANVDFGQTGFADGTFPDPETESEFSTHFSVGDLAIDDDRFVTSEGVAENRSIGKINVRSLNQDEIELEIIDGNRDRDGDNKSAFSITSEGVLIVSDRDELTEDFRLEVRARNSRLELTGTAEIEVKIIPLPFLGTPEEDILDGTADREIAFFGGGSDRANLSITNAQERHYGGTDDDILTVGSNDRAFGNAGDDQLIVATGGNNNRLYGGDGDDELYFTGNNFISGGNGIDRFFAGVDGENRLRGNSDPDFFWVVNGALPNRANLIDDFTLDEDILGFAGVGEEIDFTDLDLRQQEADTVISFNQEIAILKGIEADSLNETNFLFVEEAFSVPVSV